MKSDIEIAQECVMEPITKVAENFGIDVNDLEMYGKYKVQEKVLLKLQVSSCQADLKPVKDQ